MSYLDNSHFFVIMSCKQMFTYWEESYVEGRTVSMPVSFKGNVLRHNKRNHKTLDDTGLVTAKRRTIF
jgi:hypothetical protein